MRKVFFMFFSLWHSKGTLFIYFLLATLSAKSQLVDTSDLFNFSIDEMLQVEIASNLVNDLGQIPVSVTTISASQLQFSGGRTLADAINLFVPGFFIVEDQDDVIAAFRGLAPDNNSKVLLLINGMKMNTEWFWGPPSSILNSTDYSYIKSIEIIRGPGSVTLGQGALLGVINIITKSDDAKTSSQVSASFGDNAYSTRVADACYSEQDLTASVHIGWNDYNGQKFRNEGYGKISFEGAKGGILSESGARLKKSSDNSLIGCVDYKGFSYSFLYFDQKKDLYNFRRDRNVLHEKLAITGLKYMRSFGENIVSKVEILGGFDDFSLYSLQDDVMGGTRENRWSGNFLISINQPEINNKIAVGAEYMNFDFGKQNQSGNNFINNLADSLVVNDPASYLELANDHKSWGYPGNVKVASIFAEDYFSFGKWNLFAAFRFDNHSHWGSNLSPRIGLIYSLMDKLKIRVSHQTGFRGAVGLNYAGGYRQDGFLNARNFNIVTEAQIPVVDTAGIPTGDFQKDLSALKPETMQSTELAVFFVPKTGWRFEFTGFYNSIRNVIDVGVFWADPDYYVFQSIGTDLPGDWNGYWYFKNTKGKIQYVGAEVSAVLTKSNFTGTASHSWVSVLKADEQQKGSMYITGNNEIKAYPANVSRLGWNYQLSQKFWFGNTWMYYYEWNSPGNQVIKANLFGNLHFGAQLYKNLKMGFQLMNLLGSNRLYPMNSNSGDPRIADGTPAMEQTSFWVKLSYVFE